MRHRLGWTVMVLLLMGGIAACDEKKDDKGSSKPDETPDEGLNFAEFCEEVEEFAEEVEEDPTNTDLFDVGEPLFEEGGELIAEAEDPEDIAKIEDCQRDLAGALSDIEVEEPPAT